MTRAKLIRKWKKCVSCGCVYSYDDDETHVNIHCKSNICNYEWNYGHIFENRFFSFVKEFEPSKTDTNRYLYDDVVQLSLSVIQICKFVIGDPVIIRCKTGQAIVKNVWPLSDNILSSAFVTKLTMEEMNCFEGAVMIEQFNGDLLSIKTITIQIVDPLELNENLIDDVLLTANKKLENKIVTHGQNVIISFYGLKLHFNIKKILPVQFEPKDMNILTEEMSKINFSEKEKSQFYKITSSTSFKLENTCDVEDINLYLSLDKLGGLQNIITELRSILNDLNSDSTNLSRNLKKPYGVILHGISGTGKTQLSRSFAADSGLPVIEILSWKIFSKYYGEAELKLEQIFNDAVNKAPSIILIDELDVFCYSKAKSSDQEHRIMMSLLVMMDKLQNKKVLVLGTTRQLDLIHSAFRRPGRFDYELEMPVPTADARADILRCLLNQYNHVLTEDDVNSIAKSAHAFVGADLALMCTQANTKSIIGCQTHDNIPSLNMDHMKWALSVVKPSAMREVLVEVPNVKWDDIGGGEELKSKMKQVTEWPWKYPESLRRLGITPPRGILLFGPPGCSKTMMAKAVATESKLNFISIKGSELYNKWVGESEKAVKKLFQRARTVSPCIVFFDEIDALAGERSFDDTNSGGSNVQERVVSQLLTELDGIEALSGVTIIAATNRPDRIDSALLRPGRLDRKFYVPLPDANTREAILKLQFKKTPVAENVDVIKLASLTDGYSGAELVSVCYEAAMNALQNNLEATDVNWENFEYALKFVKPKTPQYLLDIYNKFINGDWSK